MSSDRKYLPTLSELIDRLSIIQLKEVFTLFQEWIRKGRVGNIQVNFFKGNVTSYNVSETQNFKGKETSCDIGEQKHNT